ncbi:MAG: hypothetical protein D6798_05245 [Deltaproteobacteria bacterium]|nr:MAG: hypothetical protein D6798_05245 [Deltaproteobacteria bacterium]
MHRLILLTLPLLVTACGDKGTDDTGGGGDGGSADGGSADGGSNDGGSNDGGAVDLATNLSWRLHDDIESLAYVSWDQGATATMHVEYSFDDGDWLQSPPREFTGGERAEQILVGIPYGYTAEWRVVSDDDGTVVDGDPITVGDLPEGLPLGEVLTADPLHWLPEGRYLLTSINERTGGWRGGTYWTFIMDREARPVWAHKTPASHWTLYAQLSQDGTYFMWDEQTYWSDYDDGAGSSVHRTYLDQEIDEIGTNGLHHTFVQLPDGKTLVWGSQNHGGGEALVEMNIDDMKERIIWTCQDDWPRVSYCESNGLFYDVKTDSFLYSFYTNSSLVNVDHAKGTSLWWAGTVPGGYAFDPEDSQFEWQHGVSFTADRTLLVSTEARNDSGYTTMVREYEVDHDAETLHQVWSYDPDIYASTNGDAWRLDNGNTLHIIGSAGYVAEVDADGNFVWLVDYGGSHLMGRGEYIEDLYTLVAPTE